MSDFSSEVCFRRANVDDVAQIVAFNEQLALETEGRQLDRQVLWNGVRTGLNLAPEVQYFVAEHGDQLVGQLMFTREWSDWRNGWIVWLQSVYVSSDHRGRGVFQGLLEYAAGQVTQDVPAVGVRLYVERENHAAQQVYRRLGFRDAGYHIFERIPLAGGPDSA